MTIKNHKYVFVVQRYIEFAVGPNHLVSSLTVGVCLTVLVVLLLTLRWIGASPQISRDISSIDNLDGREVQKKSNAGLHGESSSEVVTHVASSGTGLLNKYYYRLHNIELRRGRFIFYYDPNTLTPPTEEHWVDIVSCNATSPKLPTVFVIKGNAQPIRWYVTVT